MHINAHKIYTSESEQLYFKQYIAKINRHLLILQLGSYENCLNSGQDYILHSLWTMAKNENCLSNSIISCNCSVADKIYGIWDISDVCYHAN